MYGAQMYGAQMYGAQMYGAQRYEEPPMKFGFAIPAYGRMARS